MIYFQIKATLLATLVVFLTSCSGSSRVGNEPEDEPAQSIVDLSGTETFDTGKYEILPPSIAGDVIHDVPEELMLGEIVDNKSFETVSGFRIQILSSLAKDDAVKTEAEVTLWWDTIENSQRSPGLGSSDISVYLHFQSPYYRVRIGNFGQRSQAEAALSQVMGSFPSAFIVVDTVTIYQ